jgi:hypothetical protein
MTTKKEKKEEWRRLCELVVREPDPERLSQLVDQLIKELDARKQTLRRNGNRRKQVSGSATARKSRK